MLPAHRPIKVCSDIDDTFFANYHDRSMPTGVLYAGVVALYAALVTANSPGPAGHGTGGRLVWVTARYVVAAGGV